MVTLFFVEFFSTIDRPPSPPSHSHLLPIISYTSGMAHSSGYVPGTKGDVHLLEVETSYWSIGGPRVVIDEVSDYGGPVGTYGALGPDGNIWLGAVASSLVLGGAVDEDEPGASHRVVEEFSVSSLTDEGFLQRCLAVIAPTLDPRSRATTAGSLIGRMLQKKVGRLAEVPRGVIAYSYLVTSSGYTSTHRLQLEGVFTTMKPMSAGGLTAPLVSSATVGDTLYYQQPYATEGAPRTLTLLNILTFEAHRSRERVDGAINTTGHFLHPSAYDEQRVLCQPRAQPGFWILVFVSQTGGRFPTYSGLRERAYAQFASDFTSPGGYPGGFNKQSFTSLWPEKGEPPVEAYGLCHEVFSGGGDWLSLDGSLFGDGDVGEELVVLLRVRESGDLGGVVTSFTLSGASDPIFQAQGEPCWGLSPWGAFVREVSSAPVHYLTAVLDSFSLLYLGLVMLGGLRSAEIFGTVSLMTEGLVEVVIRLVTLAISVSETRGLSSHVRALLLPLHWVISSPSRSQTNRGWLWRTPLRLEALSGVISLAVVVFHASTSGGGSIKALASVGGVFLATVSLKTDTVLEALDSFSEYSCANVYMSYAGLYIFGLVAQTFYISEALGTWLFWLGTASGVAETGVVVYCAVRVMRRLEKGLGGELEAELLPSSTLKGCMSMVQQAGKVGAVSKVLCLEPRSLQADRWERAAAGPPATYVLKTVPFRDLLSFSVHTLRARYVEDRDSSGNPLPGCCVLHASGREKFVGSSVRVAARAGYHGWKGNLSDVTSLFAVCSSALGKTEGSAPGFLAVSAPGGGLVPVLAGYPY